MSAAPASSPIPCTTLNAPSGSPASRVMSASSDAVSGAHSGGLATTVLPAASAGAMRHVASISGAFHGVITTVTPDGSHSVRLSELVHLERLVAELDELVGEEAEVPRDARHDRVQVRAQQRAVVARLDRARARGRAPRRSSAIRCRTLARSAAEVRPHVSNAPRAAATARSASAGAAAGDLGDDLLVDRRDVVEGLRRADPLAADPVLGRDLDALDLGGSARRGSSPRERSFGSER